MNYSRTILATIAAAATTAVLFAAPAAAQRLPTKGEKAAITAAVKADVTLPGMRVVGIRVATVLDAQHRRFAVASRTAPNAQPDIAVLLLRADHWTVYSAGSVDQGCGIAIAVRVDIALECHGRP